MVIWYKRKSSPTPDIALLDWGTHSVRKLTQEHDKSRLWKFVAWSPDGSFIYANRTFAALVYRVNVATGSDTVGKAVAVHYYPQGGHGFSKRDDQIDAMDRIIAWFDRYLKHRQH